MKAIVCDLRRALAGRWFWAALLATTAALYLSIGQAADALMDDTQNLRFTLSELLLMALYGDFGMLTLPALSALPFAAQALHEIKCGAVRPAVFRAGRRMWILVKAAGCILSGMALQAAAAWLSPLQHATYTMHNFGYDLLPRLHVSYLILGGLTVLLMALAAIKMHTFQFNFAGGVSDA